MECSEILSESSVVRPGDTVSINPMITSESSVDMYVFIRVKMPIYNGGRLLELDVVAAWSLVEESEINNNWVEVYRYDTELKPDQLLRC